MNYATSLAKTAYKSTKSVAKYAASYVVSTDTKKDEPEQKVDKVEKGYSWMSCIIFFRNPYGKYVVDQACLILGDIPKGYHGFFTNFTNWSISNNKMLYEREIIDPNTGIRHTGTEIDSNQVYLHIRVGNSDRAKEDIVNNISDYNYYAPSPTNKMYKAIADQLVFPKVKIFDLTHEYGALSNDDLKERIKEIVDPRFLLHKVQTYGKNMENLMYNGINIPVL